MSSQDQEGRRHGQQARGEQGGVVGGPERGLGDGDPGGQKIFRVIRKYLLATHLVLSSSTPCRCSPCALLAWHSYRPRSASVTPRIWGGNMKWVSLFNKTSTLLDETEVLLQNPPSISTKMRRKCCTNAQCVIVSGRVIVAMRWQFSRGDGGLLGTERSLGLLQTDGEYFKENIASRWEVVVSGRGVMLLAKCREEKRLSQLDGG